MFLNLPHFLKLRALLLLHLPEEREHPGDQLAPGPALGLGKPVNEAVVPDHGHAWLPRGNTQDQVLGWFRVHL